MDRAIPNPDLILKRINIDIYNLQQNSYWMSVDNIHKNKINLLTSSSSLWEEFRLLTVKELSALLYLVKNKWSLAGYNKIVQVNTQQSSHKQIVFGDLTIALEELLTAFCDNNDKYNDTVLNFNFHIGWKVYKAALMNPAIVFIAFGQGPVIDQLRISLQSLDIIGKYSGNIILVTNVPTQDLQSIIPSNFIHKTKIINMSAYDQLDFVGARISILSSNILDAYQPILYSDADIVFDRDINEFLYIASFAKECSAQTEYYNKFKVSSHTGGSLFAQDSFDIEDVTGFNGGLLLIPNMKNHKQSLKAAYQTILNYTTEHGRDSIPYYDQSVLNYVLYKLQDFDPSLLSERTQIGGEPSDFNRFDPHNQKGFVHFWHTFDKSKLMEEYLETIQNKNTNN